MIVGKAIDYTKQEPGVMPDGEILERCTLCGMTGLFQTAFKGRRAYYLHIEHIDQRGIRHIDSMCTVKERQSP